MASSRSGEIFNLSSRRSKGFRESRIAQSNANLMFVRIMYSGNVRYTLTELVLMDVVLYIDYFLTSVRENINAIRLQKHGNHLFLLCRL